MRALIQRTSGATVTVDDEIVGEIGGGLVVFVCAMRDDTEADIGNARERRAAKQACGEF